MNALVQLHSFRVEPHDDRPTVKSQRVVVYRTWIDYRCSLDARLIDEGVEGGGTGEDTDWCDRLSTGLNVPIVELSLDVVHAAVQ
jgi:hypothetical protein